MTRFALLALFPVGALAACAESPPPPSVEGEIVVLAVQLADARADAIRSGKAGPPNAAWAAAQK